MNPLKTYIREISDTRATGAPFPKKSSWPAQADLLNGIGNPPKPKVKYIITLHNQGADRL